MDAELNSKNANITIINHGLSDHDAYNQMIKSGYLVEEIKFDGGMLEVADLIILGRDITNKLSDQLENQRNRALYAILGNNPDTPVIFLHNYGELSGQQTSIFLQDISDRLQCLIWTELKQLGKLWKGLALKTQL
jgi:hypothetical protein